MNLFLLGWNLDTEERRRASAALAAMHDAFPLLDPSTATSWTGRRGFACWMHHAPEALGPRHYAHRTDEALLLYDGIAVESSGRFAAHDAHELATHWDTLSDDLEGHFVAARLDDRIDTLEIVNDPLGIHPTYVHRRGDRWWIANRARLLAGAAGLTELDLEGATTYLGVHWPGADRTLVAGVTKMPAAQRWRWHGDAPIEMTTYWPLADLARSRKRRFGPSEASALAEVMRAPLRVLTDAFGPLDCPITAGHDTRMLTGLVMTTGRPADYATFGAPNDVDVVTATAIARALGLTHRSFESTADRTPEAWDALNRGLIQRNDGMLSLMSARSAHDPPERLNRIPVTLYGGGGELTRGKMLSPSFVVRPTTKEAIATVRRHFNRGGGILRSEVRHRVGDHLDRTCRSLFDLGFDAADVLTALEMIEHDRRGGAIQAFQGSDQTDVFVPFYHRAYVQAAYELSPAARLLQHVPHHLIQHLSPALRAMPSDSPWPPNNLAAYAIALTWKRVIRRVRRTRRRSLPPIREARARQRERIAILLGQLPRWRERFLDRPGAAAWQVIDHTRFEYLTSSRAPDEEKAARLANLYLAATVLGFEEDLEAWTSRLR